MTITQPIVAQIDKQTFIHSTKTSMSQEGQVTALK